MKKLFDETRLDGRLGLPSTVMVGPRGARTPIGMLAAAAALAGCGGGGGSSAQGGRTFGDSDHPLADLTVDAGTDIVPINLSAAYFEVGDGGAPSFGATLENGEDLSAAGLRLDGGNRIVGSIDDAGTVAVLVTVDDGNGETFTRSFTITAENPAEGGGRPRVDISQLAGDRRAVTGEEISAIDVTRGFRDPDGGEDDLTYAVEFSRTGHGLTFDETTNEITGEFSGTEDVTAIVTVTNGDDGGAIEHRIIISANQTPTSGEEPLPQNMTVVAGQLITPMELAAAFADPEGTPMTFEVEMADGSDLADAGLMIRDGMIMGAPVSAGVMRIRVTATDADGASSSREIIITSAEADSPTPGDDRMVNGYRDEVIDGGGGSDMVIYADDRSNYRIWRETSTDGGGVRMIVQDRTNAPGDDEGRDALMDIEVLRFGGQFGSDVPVASLTFDTPAISVARNAPTESTFTLEEEFTPIEAGGWFEGGGAKTYSFEVTGGTVEGLSIDPASGLITAAPDAGGVFVITVTASDDPDEAATYDDAVHSHTLTVVEAQSPVPSPMARVEDDHVLGSPISAIDLQRWFVDRQGDAITFEVDGLDGTGLSVDDHGVINGAPLRSGTLEITITATDTGGNSSAVHTYTLNVTTLPENALFTLQDRTVLTDRPITPIAVDGAFHDSGGGELTFTFEVGSQRGSLDSIGLEYDDSTGFITGTIDGAGSHLIAVEARNGNGGTLEQTFTVTAVETIPGQEDREPEILAQRLRDTGEENETRILPDGAVVFTKGREITPFDIRILFNDPDNDPLTHEAWVGRLGVPDNPSDVGRWGGLYDVLGLSSDNGLITGTFSDSYSGSGNGWRTDDAFEIVMRVFVGGQVDRYANFGLASDPNRGESDSVRDWGLLPSFVVHVNTAPEVSTSSPLKDIPVKVGSAIRAVSVAEGFDDPDTGATLTYSVNGLVGTGLDFADNTISGTFTGFPGMETRKTVTVTATDEHGIEATDEFILYLNSPPTLVPDAPTTIFVTGRDHRIENARLRDFFQNDDAAYGDTLTYQALLLDADGNPNGTLLEAGLRMDPVSGILSGGLTRDPENVGLEVTARDGTGESVSTRVDFMENTRPDFDESVGFPELTLTLDDPIRTPIDLTEAFSDADGHAITYELLIGRLRVNDNPSDSENWRDLSILNLEHLDGMLFGTLSSDSDIGNFIVRGAEFEIIVRARDKFGEFAVDETLTDYDRVQVYDREVLPAFAVTINVKPKESAAPLENVDFEFDGMEITPIDAGAAFADDDGDELTFSAAGLGPLAIDRETGVVTGTLRSPGQLNVTVTADDGHSTFAQEFTITAFETGMGDDMANYLTGGPGDDVIEGFGGGDTLRGGAGDDRIYGHSTTDNGPDADLDKVVYAGDWSDYLIDGRLVDLGGITVPQITLRDRNPDNGDDGVDTLVGIELLEFSDGTFTVSATATAGNDILFGTAGIDGSSLGGGDGNDIIFGFGSADDFGGGSGHDILVGGDGDDVLNSGPGEHDRFFGGRGNDSITGVGGGNNAHYLGSIYDYKYEMRDGRGMIGITDHSSGGLDGINEGADELSGIRWLEFGDGSRIWLSDIRFGIGDGTTQTLTGYAAPDIIYAKGGSFNLFGSGGGDTFQFLDSEDSTVAARTTIMDFDPSDGDRVLLQRNSELDGFSASDVDTETESGFTILSHPTSNFQLRIQGTHPDLLDYVLYIGDPVPSAPNSNAAARMGRRDEIAMVETVDDDWTGPVAEYVVMFDQHARGEAKGRIAGNNDRISEFPVDADDGPAEQGCSGPGVVAENELAHELPWNEAAPEYVTNTLDSGLDYVFNN